jgi:hypothetical protein
MMLLVGWIRVSGAQSSVIWSFSQDYYVYTAMSPGADAGERMKMNGYPASWNPKAHPKNTGKTGPG